MGDMAEKTEGIVRIERTGRFFRLLRGGEPTGSPPWLLLHGYGERADEFLDRTSGLLAGGRGELIAPEGISRFYTRGGRGAIGASWMTSLMRAEEIDEYVGMVERVLEVCAVPPGAPLNVLGFSQGGATAMRVALRSSRPVHRLVLWGAGFEEEELRTWSDQLGRIGEFLLVAGQSDRIVRREVIDRTAAAIAALGGGVRVVSHPGGHELDADLLEEIGRSSGTG